MGLYELNLEALLAPLEGDGQTGVNMRTDAKFLQLRDAQKVARAADSAALADPGSRSGADWDGVASLAGVILANDSKDIEAAAWAMEALLQTDSLAGFAFGAKLIAALIERYWEHLYPPWTEEDGFEDRLLPLVRLCGTGSDGRGSTLGPALSNLVLFSDLQGNPVTLFNYERSEATKGITDDNELELRLKTTVPYDSMQQAARAAGPGFWSGFRQNLQAAQAGWAELGARLGEVAGDDAPSDGYISELLRRIAAVVNRYAPAAVAAAGQEGAEAPGAAADGGAAAAGGGGGEIKARKMQTREDALANLTEIADYFRRTEPQSPLAYTIDEAIRRGRMSWPELLAELVDDDGIRGNILVSLGIKPKP